MLTIPLLHKEEIEPQTSGLCNLSKMLFVSLLTMALSIAGFAQKIDKDKLDHFFDRLAEKNKAMGSLAISLDGKIIYTRTIGYSQINGTEKKPATTATKYRIGSITKMFTAAMIFQLIEEGKLNLADNLDKFFPQIPNAKEITIGQMLAHRSGIHDFTGDHDYRSWKMNPKTENEMVAIIANSKPEFEPGAKFSYSNSNYVLLGYILEKITGQSYGEALKKRITSKIGLKDTYIGRGKAHASKNESLSFRYIKDWEPETETDLSIAAGAGAILSTPTDLTKFITALFNLKLISQESLDQMKAMQNGYGMGMESYSADGKILYGHTGGIDEFHSLAFYEPQEKLAVVYTANGMVYPATDIFKDVLKIYWNQPFEIPSFETVMISPEVLDKYVGVYSRPGAPVKFTISRNSNTLFIQMTGQSAVPLEPTAQNQFTIERAGMVITFDADKKQMTIERGGSTRVLTKEE